MMRLNQWWYRLVKQTSCIIEGKIENSIRSLGYCCLVKFNILKECWIRGLKCISVGVVRCRWCFCEHTHPTILQISPAVLEWWCVCSCPHSRPLRCSPGRHQPSKPTGWPGPRWYHGGRQSYCPPALCGSDHPCHSAPPLGWTHSLWRTLCCSKRRKAKRTRKFRWRWGDKKGISLIRGSDVT